MDIPSQMNVEDLTKLTGKTRRTINSRINNLEPCEKTTTSAYYKLVDALPLIYGPEGSQGLELTQERAYLARAQAEKTQLEIAKMKGELVHVEAWCEEWARAIIGFKDTLRSMALKIADATVNCKTKEEAYRIINSHANEALSELSESYRKKAEGQ